MVETFEYMEPLFLEAFVGVYAHASRLGVWGVFSYL